MWFWGNNMVLRMVSKDEIKNCSTRDNLNLWYWSLEKLDGCISHCWWWARFSLGERPGPSYELICQLQWVSLLPPPTPPNLCWAHFPVWAGVGSIFWSVELSLWGLKLHTDLKKQGLCLPLAMPRILWAGSPGQGLKWGCEHLMTFYEFGFGVNFFPCLSVD